MKVLIYGATGATGREMVKRALAQGHAVTAFVRNPQKLGMSSPRLTIVRGDLHDKQLIAQTTEGQDAVMSALGASSIFTYDEAVVTGIQNIIDAMETRNVRRFIYLSFAGVSESRHLAGVIIRYVAPRLLSTEIARHEDSEKKIIQTNLEWTVVRAPTLSNGKPRGYFRAGERIFTRGVVATVPRGDVADFMIHQLTDRSFVKQKPLILR